MQTEHACSHAVAVCTGLDAPEGGRLFPPSPVSAKKDTKGVAIKAVNAMAAAILEVSGPGEPPVQLICTGALTNAALLIALYPEVVEQSRAQVTIMGGALGVGNTGPVQEFNIQTDPEVRVRCSYTVCEGLHRSGERPRLRATCA